LASGEMTEAEFTTFLSRALTLLVPVANRRDPRGAE
jgi:hypothetical protein